MKLTNDYLDACKITADCINKYVGRNVINVDAKTIEIIDPNYFRWDSDNTILRFSKSNFAKVSASFLALLDFDAFNDYMEFVKGIES